MSNPTGRENKEPFEGTSLERFGLPVLLLGFVAGFGSCYLLLKTPNFSARSGDSRTDQQQIVVTDQSTETNEPASRSVKNELGEKTYSQVCQACHQASGQGIPGAFPPLDGSEWVSKKLQVAALVLKGLDGEIQVKGQKFSGMMPAHDQQLSNEQIASVVNYVRNSWGNSFNDELHVDEVEALRQKYKDRAPWTSIDLDKEF